MEEILGPRFPEILRNQKLSNMGRRNKQSVGRDLEKAEKRYQEGVEGRTDNERRDSLLATGGKDLGKLKGVAIDYLTGDGHEEDFISRCGPDPDGPAAPIARLPNYKRRQACCSVHEQKRGSMNPSSVYRTHARTHSRAHVIPPRIHAHPLSVFVLGALPIFLYPYRKARYERCRGRNFGVGKTGKGLVYVGENRSQIETCKKTPLRGIGKIVT